MDDAGGIRFVLVDDDARGRRLKVFPGWMVPVPLGRYPVEDGGGMSSAGVGYEMALKCGSGLNTIWGGRPP